MNKKKELINEVNELIRKAGNLRYNALPKIYFFIGISMSLFISVSANIIYEIFKNNYYAKLITFGLTIILIGYIYYLIYKTALKPINEIEKEIIKKVNKIKSGK